MAQFKNSTLTVAGLEMITQSHAIADRLNFTRLALGDGTPPLGDDRKHRADLVNERLSVTVADVIIDREKHLATVVGHVNNKTIAPGDDFPVTEIAAFANNVDGVEHLYAYAAVDDENKASWIYDRNTPIDGTDVKFVVAVSDAADIIADIDITYLMSGTQYQALVVLLQSQVDNAVKKATATMETRLKALEEYLGTKSLWEIVDGRLVPTDFSIAATPSQKGTLTYNGKTLIPDWNDFNPGKMTISGATSGLNAGEYTATFTPKDGCEWADGTKTPRNATWTIGRMAIAIPTQTGALHWSGMKQSPKWLDYDSNKMDMGGQTAGLDAGTYTATFTPHDNYQWTDGTTDVKSIDWSIGAAIVSNVPTQTGTLTYTGALQHPQWSGFNTNLLTVSGDTATNAGVYTATFTPKKSVTWSDGTMTGKTASWRIDKARVKLTVDRTDVSVFVGKSATVTVGGV